MLELKDKSSEVIAEILSDIRYLEKRLDGLSKDEMQKEINDIDSELVMLNAIIDNLCKQKILCDNALSAVEKEIKERKSRLL